MISIIVPCKNEVKTIGNTLHILSNLSSVAITGDIAEVIFIDNSDDGSFDTINEYAKAKLCKAFKQTSDFIGKGGALKQGLQHAKGDVIVFLDADVETLEADWVRKLVEPIIRGEADIVKASFVYQGKDLVTKCIAKPLLEALFPEVRLTRPIEGEIALRRVVLDKITLANDLKIESQFVIDAYMNGYSIMEVELGTKVHKERHGKSLIRLSNEVQNAILEKADEYGRL